APPDCPSFPTRRSSDLVKYPAGAHLHEDGYLIVSRFAQLLNLDDHIVRSQEVRMPCRAALVHADRQIALLGDGVRHFRAEQQARSEEHTSELQSRFELV